jgi:hypothetical protein
MIARQAQVEAQAGRASPPTAGPAAARANRQPSRKGGRLQVSMRRMILDAAIPAFSWWATQVVYRVDRNRIRSNHYRQLVNNARMMGFDTTDPDIRRLEALADRYWRAMWLPWQSVDGFNR